MKDRSIKVLAAILLFLNFPAYGAAALDDDAYPKTIVDSAGRTVSQKSTHISSYYYLDYDGQWQKKCKGASSIISYTRQYDNIQSPTAFAYGTGWYASHPVGYNSLLKDKTVAKSYQESASMHRQVEYARALKGDIAVEMNCTGATATEDGKGLLNMRIDDDVTHGTLHIGELLAQPMKSGGCKVTPKVKNLLGMLCRKYPNQSLLFFLKIRIDLSASS